MQSEISEGETQKAPNRLFAVTPLSKYLSLIIFSTLPIVFLYVGYETAEGQMQEMMVDTNAVTAHTNAGLNNRVIANTTSNANATTSTREYYGYTFQLPNDVVWLEDLPTEGNSTINSGYDFPLHGTSLKWPAITYRANLYGDFNNASSTSYSEGELIASKIKTELLGQGFEFLYRGEKPYFHSDYYIKKENATARLVTLDVAYIRSPSSTTKACDEEDANPDKYPSFVWRNEWGQCISEPLSTSFSFSFSSPIPIERLPKDI